MKEGFRGLRIALVGPVPPPHGGMANQTRFLAGRLAAEGAHVELVAVNAPYRPTWVGDVLGVRAVFRLLPYLARLWSVAGRVDIMHVMASSGWAWHLFATPAIWIGSHRGVPVVVNYRGGQAAEFFERSFGRVRPTVARARAVVVPSGFLDRVFRAHGVQPVIVPNIIDLDRFTPRAAPGVAPDPGAPHLIVSRNLEPIYDIPTALRALRIFRERFPAARLSIAGSGPERQALETLARELGLESAVRFTGRLENERMAALYRDADLALNPSLVDNMPISLLEALASGVPVVSTNVGGVPDLVEDGVTALLVPPGRPEEMAAAALRICTEPGLSGRLAQAGLAHVRQFAWPSVGPRLLAVYESARHPVGAPQAAARA